MFYIFVFGSRTESTAFADFVKRNGIYATLISTPRECMIGCGLSVRVSADSYYRVRMLLNRFSAKYTFKGIFSLEKRGMSNIVALVK